jgi:linoleoyl-CoA desaturase
VQDADTLIDDFKLGRLHPLGKWIWVFKFQYIYIPILSLFYSASLVLFKDLSIINSLRLSVSEKNKIPNYEYIIIMFSKIFAFVTTLYLPYTVLGLSILQVIVLFFIIHLGPGLLVGFFVAPAHFNNDVLFPEPDNKGRIKYSWAKHQLMTTSDFSTNNVFFNFILGGFNHHVAHHLYPSICHCHYTKITPIIKSVAKDFGIPYKSTSFYHIYFSHLKHLKKMGTK